MNGLVNGLTQLGRKLTTRLVWQFETRRNYAVRDQWKLLPPIPVSRSPIPFAVLTTPATFNDALWTAWTWLRFLGDRVRLEIFVDGEPTDEMRRWKEQLLPGSGLSNVVETIRAAGPYPPNVENFIYGQGAGRKAGLILALQRHGKFLYSDADVLAFANPREILDLFDSGERGAFYCDQKGGNFTAAIVARAATLGLTPLEDLNSGVLLVPGQSISWDLANEILWRWDDPPTSWVIEQTLFACLLSTSPMVPLPSDRYVLTNTRQFYWQPDVDYSKITARHFTGPTKHVMYRNGMPWILRHLQR